jgi:IrrE N-terminal-like domain
MNPIDRPIEQLVRETLLQHGLSASPPVDVEELARRMGVGSITRRRIVEDGRLEHRPGSSTTIVLNEAAHPTRQRFTIAHELGHLLLATPGAPVSARRSRPRYGDEERFCDAFAAALLLPPDWVLAVAGGQSPGLALTRRIADACQSSLAAVVLRCNELLSWSHALLQWRLTQGSWRLVAMAGGSLHGKVRSAPQTAEALPYLLHHDLPIAASLPLLVGDRLLPVAAEVAGSGRSAVALVDVRQLELGAMPPPRARPS